jgi:BirA family transcriptional regulator, biotin operon repressor / biotin---[acetyl-CoA-carboxylase] ligase
MNGSHIAVLAVLAGRDAPCPGDRVAQALGITRARVSQLVKELRESGTDVHVSRAGYSVPWLHAMLDASACAEHPLWTITVLPTTTSTNASLLSLTPPAEHGHVHLTEWQSAGRGRRGRSWVGMAGGSVLMSVAWRFERGAAGLSGLSLSIGLAVARALEVAGARDVQLKWPNDLLWKNQKVGGVLIDLSGDALGPTTAIIGIGLNVSLPAAARADIVQAVTDLQQSAPNVRWDRNALVRGLLNALRSTLAEFSEHGFAAHLADWRQRHAHEGRATRVLRPDGTELFADHTSVDSSGALVLKHGASFSTMHSAEVSLRLK